MASVNAQSEARVLAIASHVVYGYVGNTMATFVMQVLGCDVSALNTTQFSNHAGYRQLKGTRITAEQINELYQGLKELALLDFNMLLSGYVPSAEALEAVGKLARETKLRATTKPGTFFWVLDPVMGDQGRLYIPEDEVPIYKSLIRDADLILPNQFEAELLSEMKINSLRSLASAIKALHQQYQVPHIMVTSVSLPESPGEDADDGILVVYGSTSKSDHSPRMFRIDIPKFPMFFSGTGDMFAGLMVARFREEANKANLLTTGGWTSPDDVAPTDLPLAKAAEKTLASMQAVLGNTFEHCKAELEAHEDEDVAGADLDEEDQKAYAQKLHIRRTKSAEVRVVQNAKHLIDPGNLEPYKAKAVESDDLEAEG